MHRKQQQIVPSPILYCISEVKASQKNPKEWKEMTSVASGMKGPEGAI